MEPRAEDAEALRRRLYRPDASAGDLDRYLRAAEEHPPAADPATPVAETPRATRVRPFAIGGAAVAAAALLGAVLLTSGPPAPAASPTAATPTAVTSEGPDGSWTVTFTTGIHDFGPAAHAEGLADPEGSQIIRYTVDTGDTLPAVADRFGLCQADVLDALPYGISSEDLPDGAVLELSRSESNEC